MIISAALKCTDSNLCKKDPWRDGGQCLFDHKPQTSTLVLCFKYGSYPAYVRTGKPEARPNRCAGQPKTSVFAHGLRSLSLAVDKSRFLSSGLTYAASSSSKWVFNDLMLRGVIQNADQRYGFQCCAVVGWYDYHVMSPSINSVRFFTMTQVAICL